MFHQSEYYPYIATQKIYLKGLRRHAVEACFIGAELIVYMNKEPFQVKRGAQLDKDVCFGAAMTILRVER